MYQKERRERQTKQTKREIKTIRLGIKTGEHDLRIKADQINKFLKKGNKVKLEINLRGRERGLVEMAKEKLLSFLNLIDEKYEIEENIKRFPQGLNIMLKPGK